MTVTVTLLYDNAVLPPPLERAWGFSCLVCTPGHRVLFDTGWDGDILLDNAARLGLDLHGLSAVAISHDHWDHLGGLPRLLRAVSPPSPPVFLPASTSRSLRRELSARGPVHAVSGPEVIVPGVRSTGELGVGQREQALVLETEAGQVLVTGCAHPGLGLLLDLVERQGPVRGVVGGFHDFSDLNRLKEIPGLFPCHCTVARESIALAFPEAMLVQAGADLAWPSPITAKI